MDNTHRSHFLDADELQDLLRIPKHEVRALMTSDNPDEFPFALSTYTPRGGGHTPLSAFQEAM